MSDMSMDPIWTSGAPFPPVRDGIDGELSTIAARPCCDDVDLTLSPAAGKTLIMGPNGAGKSL